MTNAHGVHKLKNLAFDANTFIGCNGGCFNYEAQNEWLDVSFSLLAMLQPGIKGCSEENTAKAEETESFLGGFARSCMKDGRPREKPAFPAGFLGGSVRSPSSPRTRV